MAYLANANPDVPLDAVAAFYGGLDTKRFGIPSPIDVAPDMKAPVLGLFGGVDEGIPPELIKRFDHALSEAEVEHDIHVYPGAPHSSSTASTPSTPTRARTPRRRVLDYLDRIGARV